MVVLQKATVPTLSIGADSKYRWDFFYYWKSKTNLYPFSYAPQKKIAVEYVLFDRQIVLDMLSAEGGSILFNEKRTLKYAIISLERINNLTFFIRALLKKYKHPTDMLTLSILNHLPVHSYLSSC